MSVKYGKMKRHELKCLIELEYEIKVKEIHEGDKGILVFTDKGTKLLRKCKKDDGRILFTSSAYEYICNNGFTNISKINKTLSGDYILQYGSKAYILQDFESGGLLQIKTEEDATKVGLALAKFHIAGKGFVPVLGSHARVDWGKWMGKFKCYAYSMEKFLREAKESTSKSKFDKIYVKYAHIYYQRMNKAYLILKNNSYLKKVQHSMETNQITHKQFKRHSILKSFDNQVFISNMEECAYDIPEIDLASLFESFVGPKKIKLTKAALEAYNSICPLDRNSIKIIQAFLIQPKRFYKVADRYYGRKKNYTESELVHKLERSIKREEKKAEIISFLENYFDSLA